MAYGSGSGINRTSSGRSPRQGAKPAAVLMLLWVGLLWLLEFVDQATGNSLDTLASCRASRAS